MTYLLKKKNNGDPTKIIKISVDLILLKSILGCSHRYEKTPEFKRNVLIPSIKAIVAEADFDIRVDNVKSGRSIIGFNFFVKKKKFTPFFNFLVIPFFIDVFRF